MPYHLKECTLDNFISDDNNFGNLYITKYIELYPLSKSPLCLIFKARNLEGAPTRLDNISLRRNGNNRVSEVPKRQIKKKCRNGV